MKVLRLKVVAGKNAAALQQHILQTGAGQGIEPGFEIVPVQFLQKAAHSALLQFLQNGGGLGAHGIRSQSVEELVQRQRLRALVKALCQPLDQIRFVPGRNPPQVRILPADALHGIGYVENVAQPGAFRALVDEGNAPRSGLDHPVEAAVPQGEGSAGRGLRLLGVNQELILEGVAVHPTGGVQIEHPRLGRLGHILCNLLGEVVDLLIGFCQFLTSFSWGGKTRPNGQFGVLISKERRKSGSFPVPAESSCGAGIESRRG